MTRTKKKGPSLSSVRRGGICDFSLYVRNKNTTALGAERRGLLGQLKLEVGWALLFLEKGGLREVESGGGMGKW